MKRNQVNALLTEQTKRRNTVLTLACIIVIIFALIISLFLLYFKRNEKQYVSYDETSEINYKVFLKKNNFFEKDYLGTNKQYIASLIDYINTDFNYKLSLEEKNVEYKYSYKIEANVEVKETQSENLLYNTTKILKETTEETTSLNEVEINEAIDINYNYYNNLIKNFISIYGLEDTESVLKINMYVNVVGTCEDFKENDEKESVMSLTIPLTTKTMAIDISDDLINSENNVMQCESIYTNNEIILAVAIILTLLDIYLIIHTIRYEIKTRTAETIYEKELKKILNNYSSYIQMLDNDFNFKNYQLLKVNTFTDMLEIRDTIKQPILMKENPEKTGAYFIIPSSTKILYVYRLKISDIKKDINKKQQNELDEFL